MIRPEMYIPSDTVLLARVPVSHIVPCTTPEMTATHYDV
jgi:hypothetical protein